jgi:hypothetical protein
MSTLLLTAYTKNMSSLNTITKNSKIRYAARYGYQFHSLELPIIPNIYPAWLKLPLLLDFIPHYERIFWIDADAFITNQDISLESIPYQKGLTVSHDWGVDARKNDFSSAVMIITPEATPLFQRALQKKKWQLRPLWDQNGLREASREIPGLLTILPRKTFNAVPEEIHPWAPEPWEEGDFICHMTCASNELREKIFKELQEEYSHLSLYQTISQEELEATKIEMSQLPKESFLNAYPIVQENLKTAIEELPQATSKKEEEEISEP